MNVFKELFFGLPLAAYGGMVLFVLLLLQVLGGLHYIKMPLNWHKWLGIGIVVFAAFHALLGLLYFLG